MDSEMHKIFLRKKHTLCTRIKPNIEFVTLLEANGVLTRNETQQVQMAGTDYCKNVTVIDNLRTHSHYQGFLCALEDTNQRYIAEYIREPDNI